MFPSTTKAIALALCLAVIAVECNIVVPEMVSADTDFTLDLSEEISAAAGYDAYRVYLMIDAAGTLVNKPSPYDPAWFELASCSLVKSAPITESDVTVQVPTRAGANDGYYAIIFEAYNKADILVESSSGYEYTDAYNTSKGGSATFLLSGGTGPWSKDATFLPSREHLLDYTDPINVPCTAWDCARNCTNKYVGDKSTIRILGNDYPTKFRDTWNCVKECPGVTYPAFHVLFGLDENYNEIITTTVLGPLSTTATKTIFATSVSYPSFPSTGTGTLATPTPFSNSTATASVLSSSTSSRISTPTIDTTPSPTGNAGTRVGMADLIHWLASVLLVLVLGA